jgi:hypothetical protein
MLHLSPVQDIQGTDYHLQFLWTRYDASEVDIGNVVVVVLLLIAASYIFLDKVSIVLEFTGFRLLMIVDNGPTTAK